MNAKPIEQLSSLAGRYQGFVLDLWGVVHDGTALYPGALETLKALHAAKKRVVFLSNAPRRAEKVVSVLDALGVERGWYEAAVSSGEVAYYSLARGECGGLGRRYCFIGPQRDADVLDGLSFTRVDTLEEADFLLNVGFGSEEQEEHAFDSLLKKAVAFRLPMLCLNPDREVVKITGERYACAGVIAANYERLGGSVRWFGKPYPEVYAQCLRLLAPLTKSEILAVGDGLFTDILGANRAGLTSVLVTGGILKGKFEESGVGEARPDYVMPELRW